MQNFSRIAAAALLAAVLIGVAVLGSGGANRLGAYETVVRMERLATKLEHAKNVPPETSQEISRLLREDWQDCDQTACHAWLKERHRAAQARLQAVVEARNLAVDVSTRAKR